MVISTQKKSEINPNMFGLFFEDINYAADGGLYAELIENRSFEAKEGFGNPGNFYTVDDFGYAWSPISKDEKNPMMQFVSGSPLSESNPHYLRFTASEAGQGFFNKAYDGIFLSAGDKINVVFYARAVRYDGLMEVSLRNRDTGAVICSKTIKCKPPIPFKCWGDLTVDIGDEELKKIDALDRSENAYASEWVKYEVDFPLEKELENATLAICLCDEGAVDFDYISAIPESAVCGVFRKDIFDVLKAMKPGFIRFPGGCIVEGISLLNRYRWKNTVGKTIDRVYTQNLWSFDDDGSKTDLNAKRVDSHYGQSFGIGFYEYFLLCEKLGAKALPVLNMGIACQFRSTQLVDINSPEFDEYVQDALDLIEFANGDASTKWGKLRADMGHPDSFNLELLAIGNEQWKTKRIDLFERNDIFEKAIHEKYPDIKLLGTAGPVVDMAMTDIAWDYYREKTKANDNFCYAVDEHYYKSPEWMYENISLYDNYEGKPYVFAGEYAAHTQKRANSMESALAEAAFMTGLEVNAGVVKLASYAPLFNRIGHSQWKPDMIWFDAKKVYLTPNYYVQSMYANNVGEYALELTDEMRALRNQGIYVSTSEDKNGEIIFKAVNTTNEPFELKLDEVDGNPVCKNAKIIILTGEGVVSDDMPEISHVSEIEATINGKVNLAAKSFNVIRLG